MPERKTRREMLAAIALATDLPCPPMISFDDGLNYLLLNFNRVADAAPWGDLIGEPVESHRSASSRRYIASATGMWHGWRVGVHAEGQVEPVDELPDDTREALDRIAAPHPRPLEDQDRLDWIAREER